MKVRQKFDAEYEALSQEEIAALKHQAEEEQQNKKKKVPKQLKRAQQHDVTKTANSFQEAVSVELLIMQGANVSKLDALHVRTGHHGLCILVCGDRSINSRPIFVSSGNGNLGDFFEDYISKPLLGILEDLDAWCTNGLKGILFYFILFYFILFYFGSLLHSIGLAQGKKSVQECKKYVQNHLKLDLREYSISLVSLC